MKTVLHDKDIREPLFDYLDEKYGKIRILEEKTMGKSRADVVMVTDGCIYGIEIKSDADTYSRLKRQVKDYDKYYDRNYVVIGISHAMHIEEHVPAYWGIITVEMKDGAFDFRVVREPEDNPKMKWKSKLEIMWRPELAMLQIYNKMPKYKQKSKDYVKNQIVDRLEKGKIKKDKLNEQITYLLFERDYNDISSVLKEYRKNEKEKKLND